MVFGENLNFFSLAFLKKLFQKKSFLDILDKKEQILDQFINPQF